MDRDIELWKLAIEIEESGVVESGKQEYDFDIDLLIRLCKENDSLKRSIMVYQKQMKYWRWKYYKKQQQCHVYKVEMERLRRKLTRIYAHYKGLFKPSLDRLKKL